MHHANGKDRTGDLTTDKKDSSLPARDILDTLCVPKLQFFLIQNAFPRPISPKHKLLSEHQLMSIPENKVEDTVPSGVTPLPGRGTRMNPRGTGSQTWRSQERHSHSFRSKGNGIENRIRRHLKCRKEKESKDQIS